jgi:hypothetical protein
MFRLGRVVLFLAVLSLVACERREGDAIVTGREHIPAAAPADHASEITASPESTVREMASDEIAVDGVVMKAKDRGTVHDPRALKDEQWLITVRLVDGGRVFKVPTERSQYEKISPGERVRVRYHVGKYTGTVWSAELEVR